MKKSNIAEFTRGWLIGNFEPALIKSDQLEIGVKDFAAGAREPSHHQLIATEWTVVLSGECSIGGSRVRQGEIVEIVAGESSDFRAVTNCQLLVIKSPSIPSDKVEEG